MLNRGEASAVTSAASARPLSMSEFTAKTLLAPEIARMTAALALRGTLSPFRPMISRMLRCFGPKTEMARRDGDSNRTVVSPSSGGLGSTFRRTSRLRVTTRRLGSELTTSTLTEGSSDRNTHGCPISGGSARSRSK